MSNHFNEDTAFEISKVFPLAPEKLFRAFLDEEILKKIWGVSSISIDARPEGKAHAIFGIDGENWNFTVTYKEIIPNEKIRWVVHFERFPEKEPRVTLSFKSLPSGCEFHVRMENLGNSDERDEHRGAWNGALNKLEQII